MHRVVMRIFIAFAQILAALILQIGATQAEVVQVELERCFQHESETLVGYVILQTDDDIVNGIEFGTVSTSEGETWGVHVPFEGSVRDGRLYVTRGIHVDGDVQVEEAIWQVSTSVLRTDAIEYQAMPCASIWAEFDSRDLADNITLRPSTPRPGAIYSTLTGQYLAGVKPHELGFQTPNDGVARAEFASDPFFAIILLSAPRCTLTEAERLAVQEVFPNHKVFMERFACDDDVLEYMSYTNVSPEFGFIAVHAGASRSGAEALMTERRVRERFPGANIRQMQAVINFP